MTQFQKDFERNFKNLKNLSFRELLLISVQVDTQEQLDAVNVEMASRKFWMEN